MKIVLFVRQDRFDLAELIRRHPEHSFVHAADTAAAARELPGAEAMVTWTSGYDEAFVRTVQEKADALRWIQFTTSGIDSVLRAGGFPPGTIVTNSSGLSAPMVSEHAFALMLMLGHRLRDALAAGARREWPRDLKTGMIALYKKTICIIGLGAIGEARAEVVQLVEDVVAVVVIAASVVAVAAAAAAANLVVVRAERLSDARVGADAEGVPRQVFQRGDARVDLRERYLRRRRRRRGLVRRRRRGVLDVLRLRVRRRRRRLAHGRRRRRRPGAVARFNLRESGFHLR